MQPSNSEGHGHRETKNPLMNDLILKRIFTFLTDEEKWKARLVSPVWNSAFTSFQKIRMTQEDNFIYLSAEYLETRNESILNDSFKALLDKSKNPEFLIESITLLSPNSVSNEYGKACLQNYGIYTRVLTIPSNHKLNARTLYQLLSQFCPYLKTLEIWRNSSNPFKLLNVMNKFKINKPFPYLTKLVMVGPVKSKIIEGTTVYLVELTTEVKTTELKAFAELCSRIIQSAPFLQCLEIEVTLIKYLLPKLKNTESNDQKPLQLLKILLIFGIDDIFEADTGQSHPLNQLLSIVSNSILMLHLQCFFSFTANLDFPLMKNLKYLTAPIVNTPNPMFRIGKLLKVTPNLETLHMWISCTNWVPQQNSSLPDIIFETNDPLERCQPYRSVSVLKLLPCIESIQPMKRLCCLFPNLTLLHLSLKRQSTLDFEGYGTFLVEISDEMLKLKNLEKLQLNIKCSKKDMENLKWESSFSIALQKFFSPQKLKYVQMISSPLPGWIMQRLSNEFPDVEAVFNKDSWSKSIYDFVSI